MGAFLLRSAMAAAAVVAIVVVVLALWSPPTGLSGRGAGGQAQISEVPAPTDGGDLAPVSDAAGPHQLIRYEMPRPKTLPPLRAGATDLTWQDLWTDGTLTIDDGGKDRLGTPGKDLFPDGSTAEDISNFFLDIADMRALQANVGGIRPDLDGKRVRLAGYTTPVGFGPEETSFLLVPELGACIHVPPPPPNQIVYVEKAATTPNMFAPVWVTGTLRAKPVATILADVGYQLEDVVAEPYN
ncbi:DUF3299 domain-containing protein [Acuticoccus mangrovi]|uniref:DUF3299 domain-containing protein n=1 Tax=Acuticoccus mangrovi TaxID=2796142 RepID=A0A934IIM1_9HYPH|nr:DUF3299 domain-containing protein [Acuticoccus mangrovi]MBJ3775681.1 DUF3299 domain-containing protein [Acuticoccus mangrovi]